MTAMSKTPPADDSKTTTSGMLPSGPIDPAELQAIMVDVSERMQPLLQEFFEHHEFDPDEFIQDPMDLRPALFDFFYQLGNQPKKVAELQMRFMQDWADLYRHTAEKFIEAGQKETDKIQSTLKKDLYEPEKSDRRFRSPLWQQGAWFDFLKQSYILAGRQFNTLVEEIDGLDEPTRKRVSFFTRQVMDALSPTNFPMTNPEVLQEIIDTKGDNLIRGMKNMLEDLERGKGKLQISMTRYDSFELGKNLAATPGQVIFKNDLFELIQYEPTTKEVHKTPLLVVPPCFNKYYILDLGAKKSLVKWLVDQGHTVFMLSWVNPGKKHGNKGFESYIEDGILKALDIANDIAGTDQANVIGYCQSGTLLAMALAILEDRGEAQKVASATYLTTLLDFTESGELELFMTRRQLEALSNEMKEKGFLPGSALRQTFSWLRSNDLIWSFVVNNYLLGKEPFPFDILYWNDDPTNMPFKLHSQYLKRCYLDNALKDPGKLKVAGVPIDLKKIKTPTYFLSTREDHIAPWEATYRSAQLLGGKVRFTLAAAGHVAGVINPPASGKYCHWTSRAKTSNPDQWIENATMENGSWWPDWDEWVREFTGTKVKARTPGNKTYKPIEAAPGSYVKAKAD